MSTQTLSRIELCKCTCFLLAKADQKANALLKKELSEIGLTPVQAVVLACLLNEDGINFKSLSEKSMVDTSTLTGIVDRMEAAGFLKRKVDENDRRSINIYLTDRGRSLKIPLFEIMKRTEEKLTELLTKREIAELQNILKKIKEIA